MATPANGRSNFGAGRWKSGATQSAQSRAAPAAPLPDMDERPAPPQALSERLPGLSDQELASLLANATRVSQDAKNRKQAEAADLLPLIAEELERRAGAKAEAAVERKKATATKRASTRATKLSEKAALEDPDEDDADE